MDRIEEVTGVAELFLYVHTTLLKSSSTKHCPTSVLVSMVKGEATAEKVPVSSLISTKHADGEAGEGGVVTCIAYTVPNC